MSFKNFFSSLFGFKSKKVIKELEKQLDTLEDELESVYLCLKELNQSLSTTLVEAKRIKHSMYAIELKLERYKSLNKKD